MTFHVCLNQMKPVIFFAFQRFHGKEDKVVFIEKSLLISTNRNTGTPKFPIWCKFEANPVQCENVYPRPPGNFEKTHAILTKIFMNRSWFLHISSLSSLFSIDLVSVKYLFVKYKAIQFYYSWHLRPSLGNGRNSMISWVLCSCLNN